MELRYMSTGTHEYALIIDTVTNELHGLIILYTLYQNDWFPLIVYRDRNITFNVNRLNVG